MVSMVLMALWGTFDFFLLAAGGVMIAFSILWKAPDVFRNLVLTDMDLTGTSPCAHLGCLLTACPWLPIPPPRSQHNTHLAYIYLTPAVHMVSQSV